MRERDDAAVTGGAAAALQGTTFSATSPLPPSLSDPSPKDAVELTPGIIGKCTACVGWGWRYFLFSYHAFSNYAASILSKLTSTSRR